MNIQQTPSFSTLPQSLQGCRIPFVQFGGCFYMGRVLDDSYRYKKWREAKGLLSKKKNKKGERTFADTFTTRSAKLKTSYKDYLKSDHWKRVKAKTKRRKKYRKCMFCGSRKVELHHTTYKWIYTKKELLAIIPLCRTHHQEVHDFSANNNISVRLASNAMIRKYKRINS